MIIIQFCAAILYVLSLSEICQQQLYLYLIYVVTRWWMVAGYVYHSVTALNINKVYRLKDFELVVKF